MSASYTRPIAPKLCNCLKQLIFTSAVDASFCIFMIGMAVVLLLLLLLPDWEVWIQPHDKGSKLFQQLSSLTDHPVHFHNISPFQSSLPLYVWCSTQEPYGIWMLEQSSYLPWSRWILFAPTNLLWTIQKVWSWAGGYIKCTTICRAPNYYVSWLRFSGLSAISDFTGQNSSLEVASMLYYFSSIFWPIDCSCSWK